MLVHLMITINPEREKNLTDGKGLEVKASMRNPQFLRCQKTAIRLADLVPHIHPQKENDQIINKRHLLLSLQTILNFHVHYKSGYILQDVRIRILFNMMQRKTTTKII